MAEGLDSCSGVHRKPGWKPGNHLEGEEGERGYGVDIILDSKKGRTRGERKPSGGLNCLP